MSDDAPVQTNANNNDQIESTQQNQSTTFPHSVVTISSPSSTDNAVDAVDSPSPFGPFIGPIVAPPVIRLQNHGVYLFLISFFMISLNFIIINRFNSCSCCCCFGHTWGKIGQQFMYARLKLSSSDGAADFLSCESTAINHSSPPAAAPIGPPPFIRLQNHGLYFFSASCWQILSIIKYIYTDFAPLATAFAIAEAKLDNDPCKYFYLEFCCFKFSEAWSFS